MMQAGWTAPGWLGLLTAGTLWTPMHDPSTMKENVDGLVRQIMLALAPNDEEEPEKLSDNSLQQQEAEVDFTRQELRDELDRLKDSDQAPTLVRAGLCHCVLPPLGLIFLLTARCRQYLRRGQ
eukprot:COSAG01_NODE_5877_length_3973_cov_2.627001_6_plen_123_part_00